MFRTIENIPGVGFDTGNETFFVIVSSRETQTVAFKNTHVQYRGMNAGDRVRVVRNTTTYEGVLMPSSTPDHLVLKLSGGYNVGVSREQATVELLESDITDAEPDRETPTTSSEITFDSSLPTISLISTGGTIASTVDYRTGAVTAQFDAEDVLRAVPELAGRANYRGRVVSNILSENMTPSVWVELAETVYEEIEAGSDGVVIMHGTDTMQYTASALSFMLESPVPIILTGSQRSADRPSSDNVMNAVCAIEAAKADHSETLVCMHATESDDYCFLHQGTRVRKNHTSRRDAFETVGGEPIGLVDWKNTTVEFNTEPAQRGGEATIHASLDENVELVKFVPGMDSEFLRNFSDINGLVIEGTGLGHVNTQWIEEIRALVSNDIPVVMTSQCLEGRVCDRVYDTGRDLLEAGVVEAGDTLPETAYVKLMWALANTDSVEDTMQRPLAGELQRRSVPWT